MRATGGFGRRFHVRLASDRHRAPTCSGSTVPPQPRVPHRQRETGKPALAKAIAPLPPSPAYAAGGRRRPRPGTAHVLSRERSFPEPKLPFDSGVSRGLGLRDRGVL